MTIPMGAETCSAGVRPTVTFTIARLCLRQLAELRLDALGHAFRADPEVREHRGALARLAERVDPDRRIDPARPAERRAGLDGDLRQVRGKDLVAVLGGLSLEELPARHRDDPSTDAR